MYEGIFDDFREVQEILKEADVQNIPNEKIFNLLEEIKSPKIVAQVLMESKECKSLDVEMLPLSCESTLERKESDIVVIKEIKNDEKAPITVDLTKVTTKASENDELMEISHFTADSSELNDCSNDSDVENYYTTSEYEEDTSTKEEEGISSKSPPPILSILKDLCENPVLLDPGVPTFQEVNEVEESFEILEENNNDPNNNNNLEEIQLVEPRQSKSPVAGCSKDFNKVESERPGASKMLFRPDIDPDLSGGNSSSKMLLIPDDEDSDLSARNCPSNQGNLEPQPSCSRDCIELEESDSEIEEQFETASQVNYEKLLEETELLSRVLPNPNVNGNEIFSMLDKYKNASNRMMIVLFDLMPRERPKPIFLMQRKKQVYSPRLDSKIIKKIQQDVKNSDKEDISKMDVSHTSTENNRCYVKNVQNVGETVKFDVNVTQQTEPLSDASKNLIRSKIVQPANFVYQSKPLSPMHENQAPIVKKNVLSPAKLIINSAEAIKKNSNVEIAKLSVKRPKHIEIVSAQRNVTTALPNFTSAQGFRSTVIGFQKFQKIARNEQSSSNASNEVLPKSSQNSSSFAQAKPPAALDFLKPNGENQFYQIPEMNPAKLNPVKLQSHQQINGSKASTSAVDLSKSYAVKIQSHQQINGSKPSTSTTDPSKLLKVPVSRPDSTTINIEANKAVKNREIPCKDTYYKLRSVFPDIDPEFIKEKCINPPFDVKSLNMEQQLSMFVELLLIEGTNHRQVHQINSSDEVGNKDEQYENLLGIFPEADPMYLRKFVDDNFNKPDSLKNFIQNNLENPTYPTRSQYQEKIKMTQQIKEYTTEFNVQKFLQTIPDPVAHFENPNRLCQYSAISNEFLKDVFRKHKVNTISLIYRRKNYHLSLAAKELSSLLPDMKGKRGNIMIPTENIPLLQEMAYIKHKRAIVDYLEGIKTKEMDEFEDLKKRGQLVECQCCFSDECLPRKCFTCEKGHIFCHSCILKGTESKMGDGQNHVACFTNCDSEFSLSVLQEVLPPITFSILLQKRQAAEVMAAGLEGLVSCPFCHFASIPPTESKVFKCLNPDCMKETCRFCKELNHVPLRCDEVLKEDQARLQLEEKMTEALVRNCYKCQKPFFKEEGCNKMTCVCGASMCYLCSTPLKNGDYKHFNGQGSTNSNLCPLWTDNRRMNAEAVRKVAEATENELKKKNPNLKINTKAILPVLPQKTRGPHDDIPNANRLPEHVRRIANIAP